MYTCTHSLTPSSRRGSVSPGFPLEGGPSPGVGYNVSRYDMMVHFATLCDFVGACGERTHVVGANYFKIIFPTVSVLLLQYSSRAILRAGDRLGLGV